MITKEQLRLELPKAIEDEAFHMVYQPQINMLDGTVVGVESLIRWTHPEYGSISPVQFIPIAEEVGLISKITEWVVRQGVSVIVDWQNKQYPFKRLAVNVSATDLTKGPLRETISNLMKQHALHNSLLALELTEAVSLPVTYENVELFRAFVQDEFHLILDDFGTGYSNLDVLNSFPFQTIKIDRSLIHTLHTLRTQIIVKRFVELAQQLQMNVIAEGVETKKQLQLLEKVGCHYIQGYYYSKPLSKVGIEQYFEKG